ncbi:MAG: hypothetical protein EOP78_18935 [Variovorax sp.]|nr:MAG: hypothetical protein EOP78_18935 [Variovorax sp.]
MPNLSIKDVPEAWTEALRQRAARNHRSLQGELMAILERVMAEGEAPAGNDARGKPVLRRGTRTIEQIHADHLLRFPKPIKGARSVDLIREDRDAR